MHNYFNLECSTGINKTNSIWGLEGKQGGGTGDRLALFQDNFSQNIERMGRQNVKQALKRLRSGCGAMCSASAWPGIMHCVACLRTVCIIIDRHIGSGTARRLL